MDKTIKGLEHPKQAPNGSGLSVLIVRTQWNAIVVDSLVQGCLSSLKECGVTTVDVSPVPGSFELPMGVQIGLEAQKYDAIIAIGVLIKGSTMHFEYIADATSHGLMRLGLDYKTPVIFGLLTCLTEAQAQERAGLLPNGHNHGLDWGFGAVQMALLKKS